MRKYLVITVTGHDRTGLVEYITKRILAFDGNVEASQMARLGGEFAMLMMVSVSAEKLDDLRENVRQLRQEDFKVTTRETQRGVSTKYTGWMPYRVKVNGADHEGIIHQIAAYMAEHGVNIETMETGLINAPMSGIPLFTMDAVVVVPPNLDQQDWREELVAVGDRLNVDVEVSRYTG